MAKDHVALLRKAETKFIESRRKYVEFIVKSADPANPTNSDTLVAFQSALAAIREAISEEEKDASPTTAKRARGPR
ncbi:MAG: hypothetical protein U1E67_20125 [Hyphomicrobiales bacterium]